MHKTGMKKNRVFRMLLLAVVFAAGLGIGVKLEARKVSDTSGDQEVEAESPAAAGTAEESESLSADETASEMEISASAGTAETSTETVVAGVEALLLAESGNAGTDDSEGTGTVLEDFPLVEQYPELPTGCEITALTMVLQYYGFEVSKMTMALEYLPTVADEQYRDRDGTLYGSDLENYFVGDPTTESGYVCGTGAIVTAAEAFLEDQGSDLTVSALEGVSPDTLYDLLDEGIPSVIWCTIGMESRAETQGWYRSDGTYMEWSTNDHGAVLIGYDEDTVTVADPIDGLCEYSRTQFEKVFAQRGQKCVFLT